tara:strand:+ start:490 stop:1143 length:654 start_codon:yes stop_codon:yes gene_type:complete
MVSFWLENPNNLLNKNYITEIWPNSDFNLARKLNAITRLIIILTILGYFFTKSPYIPVSALVSIVILVIIYKTKIKTEKLEEFVGSFKKREHPHAVKDLDAMMQKEFTMPTKKNPVMNVLMTEYSENPNRKPAAPSYNEVVEEEINDKAERKDNKLFKNLGDNLSFEHSMRNFYAMPNTKIPNNQKDFAMFCYGNMPSCKDGDALQCSKNNALFRTT